jgi:16S rRNA (guanine966-N2)-methyltransferase
MRIVGGRFKGRTLAGPASGLTRPTSDRVRESVFNILTHGIAEFTLDGCRVIDLFAGTGALGIEALSRGAKFCQFVEESAEARGVIRQNADSLGAIGLCKIWRRDATRLGDCAPQSPFGLAFCDPPYGKGFGEKSLRALIDGGWLERGAVVMLEETASVPVEHVDGLEHIDTRSYGDTQIVFFRHR